jgi:hypothetical protein
MLGPLLKRRSSLSVRNGVLLYKQFIHPMMDYARPIWRSAARSHVRELQVLQSECLRIANNALWHAGNTRIWGFHSSLTTSESPSPAGKRSNQSSANQYESTASIAEEPRWHHNIYIMRNTKGMEECNNITNLQKRIWKRPQNLQRF